MAFRVLNALRETSCINSEAGPCRLGPLCCCRLLSSVLADRAEKEDTMGDATVNELMFMAGEGDLMVWLLCCERRFVEPIFPCCFHVSDSCEGSTSALQCRNGCHSHISYKVCERVCAPCAKYVIVREEKPLVGNKRFHRQQCPTRRTRTLRIIPRRTSMA